MMGLVLFLASIAAIGLTVFLKKKQVNKVIDDVLNWGTATAKDLPKIDLDRL